MLSDNERLFNPTPGVRLSKLLLFNLLTLISGLVRYLQRNLMFGRDPMSLNSVKKTGMSDIQDFLNLVSRLP
jgi:hypothetical protein